MPPEIAPTSLFNNPAVIGGGIGGIIAVLLILVLWRMLIRIDDTIHLFITGQERIITSVTSTADKITTAFRESSAAQRTDQQYVMLALERIQSKQDILLDRTSRTFEQVAFHRGVSETQLTGSPPAVVTSKE